MSKTSINFNVALKTILQEGTLAWEYNPFRNYRLDEDMIYYKDLFYTPQDFITEFNLQVQYIDKTFINEDGSEITDWSALGFPKTEEIPVFYQKGQLVDFVTNEFDFDLNHPVLITPTYSYDNSVDLIINDGKNLPKIINSRFSAVGKNKYKIVDRNGNNDSNIYDKGDQFDLDTSLYKITSQVPRVTFGGEAYGGNLKVGNYHFYFKYSDSDGNESDFIAQSGLVSVFLGNTPNSINSGFRDQNSNKKVRFILSNTDLAYDYILVYYSRSTSEEFENRTTEYIKLNLKYKTSLSVNTIIDVTGFEETEKITFEDINLQLLVYDSAKTLAVSLNMLFLGNVTQGHLDHEDLSRLALYIIPSIDSSKVCEINSLSSSYLGDTSNTYYNPNFIYNYTGYWDDEIYRFGVIFIKSNNTLTPVYNVRGLHLGEEILSDLLDRIKLKDTPISYDEVSFNISSDFQISRLYGELENAKGVCYIPQLSKLTDVIGVRFQCHETVISALKNKGIKGYIIVRLKRIPTTLCLAYTIGTEMESHLPMLPVGKNSYIYESFLDEKKSSYTYWDEDGRKKPGLGYLLSNVFANHKRTAPPGSVSPKAAICPDYDVNTPYLNSLFTGSDFVVNTIYSNHYLEKTNNERLFVTNLIEVDKLLKTTDVKIIGVEDNVKLVGIGDLLFSARAGDAEEAFRYSCVGTELREDHGGNNIIRGSFGPYLGIEGYASAGDLITIKIPGYNPGNLLDYFKIRYHDASSFYPISDRILLDNIITSDKDLSDLGLFYRGDCYICKFTHRLNRNFTDADTPTNDTIVDPSCWTHNIFFEDLVLKTDNLDKINLGDINAVNLGMWVSFILRSNINHSVRSINESNVDESSLIGHGRGFYPYYPISAKASYKLPESGTYNKGFEASVGEQVFAELPAVPYYKDIFSTRIAYSNIQISNAFKNAYRVFLATHFRDYPITYGEITKIVEWNGDLICVLEHGVYRIPINERAVAGEGSGGSVFINTSNVLPENPLVLSDTFGSLWIDSIIKTPIGIYGVDTVAKKIWRVDNNGMEIISDFKLQKFLNDNITLSERELTPIIGIRNVKTHYNAFKHDVMFTFYDDILGVDEVAWNICWNESINKWITFYSWVPSFSENIHNSYFSFDRETSRYIALLSLNEKSEYNDLIYLDHKVFTKDDKEIGNLQYDLTTDGTTVSYKWELINDPYCNKDYFSIDPQTSLLKYKNDYSEYVISPDTTITYNGEVYHLSDGVWKDSAGNKVDLTLSKTLSKERMRIWREKFETVEKNPEGLTKRKVYLLNVRVTPTITYSGENATYAEYISNQNANRLLTGGFIERTIAVIPKDHLEALSTDFWKHGLAGIIDIKEEIKPTFWYNKQHPFEFEFIVRDHPDAHKIFDNLILISNKAEPESFHYEIVGECYEFAKDKKNMYIRQEATKELFLNEGYDISFNSNYKELTENHRKITDSTIFDKSTIFPLYYLRKDAINTIEDYYHQRPGEEGKDFSNLTGSEIVYNKDLNEFRIWTHSEAVNVTDNTKGVLRGNMYYKEDKWNVQIPPINLVQKNEPDWALVEENTFSNSNKIPIELRLSNFVGADVVHIDNPVFKERGLVLWKDKIGLSLAKLKDKYIKVRVRYSGKDLAVIAAIKTLYSISYA